MLSVRLPETLEKRLTEYCETMNVTKSYAVQAGLEKHLKKAAHQGSVKGAAKKSIF
jgi:predicted DNA-binding protein